MLAQVEPGDVQAALPPAPPDEPEPFAAVLRDLDDVLMPGITHWQSPRFFAYFATTGSEPGILAELLIAGLNQVGILWRTSPALQELEEVTLDWLAQLLGLPAGLHGHIEDTASTGTLFALAVARALRPTAASCSRASTRTRPSTRRRSCSSSSSARSRSTTTFRLRTGRFSSSTTRARCSRRSERPASTAIDPDSGDRRRVARRTASGCTSMRPTPAPAAVCPELRDRFAGWERADSIVVNPHKWLGVADGLLDALDAAAPRTSGDAFSLVPEFLRVAGGRGRT